MALDDRRFYKRFADGIQRLIEQQRELVDAIAKHTKAEYKAAEPSPTRQPERVSEEPHPPPEVINRYYAEHHNTYLIQRRTFWVSVFTLLALVVYTAYTIKMYRSNKEAAEAATNAANTASNSLKSSQAQFEIDERAYVWITKIGPPPHLDPNAISLPLDQLDNGDWPTLDHIVFFNLYFTNSGKTPAIDVKNDVHVVFGEKARRGCFAFVRSSTLDVADGSGAAIAPGKFIWTTAMSLSDDSKFPARMIPWTGAAPILIYGIVSYRDIFGKLHRSKECSEYLPNGHSFSIVPGQTWIDYQEAQK